MYLLHPFHIQYRIRVALFVHVRPLADKPHVQIKARSLRVLFVDDHLAYAVVVDGVLQQTLAYAFAPVLGGNKQHFKLLPLYACKRYGHVLLLGNDEEGHFPYRLRHVFPYFFLSLFPTKRGALP